ncbi:hypothetical protein [Antrihabitans stalactiti]|uniref:Uncharacterized protein n=1 Tax=Antrihabitans stalactiti TaxID=2584121 RepID=A0A848KMW6_9NOCA|nr:hypothetical protein [Antrihabitans stalactiti]NMN99288.1 hypothetical protein [Antrihabitans stalactiti]
MNTQINLGPRDMDALLWLAEMYGQPMTVVAGLLDVDIHNAYRIVRRWRAAGMVAKAGYRPVPGPSWVFPTRSAAEGLLDSYVRYWIPTAKMAAHHSTVGWVRLALTGPSLDRWTSERLLRLEVGPAKAGETRKHIHDGRYTDDLGKRWAVEVELTEKSKTAGELAVRMAYETARDAGLDGLIYYYRTTAVKKAVTRAAALLDGPGKEGAPKFFTVDLQDLLADRTSARSSQDVALDEADGAMSS